MVGRRITSNACFGSLYNTNSSINPGISLKINHNVLVTQAYCEGEVVCDNNIVKNKARFTTSGLRVACSEIAFPLKFQNRVLGVLDIQSERIQAFKPDDISVLQITTSQIALAIYNARLYSELDRLKVDCKSAAL